MDKKVALVTGGAGGVGQALCRNLAGRGAHVIVVDVDSETTASLADELAGTSLCFDVGDRDSWDDAVRTIDDRHGRLDILALNAGIMARPKGEPMGSDDPLVWLERRYDLVRRVNIDGVVNGLLACIPSLERDGGGRIVVTSSIAGIGPLPEDPAYSLSKHAGVGLVRSLGPTLARRGISIGAVCPGGIDTSLVAPDFRDAGFTFATPEHVAEALVEVLDRDIAETGGIWVSLGLHPPFRYEFAPLR